MSPLRLLIGVVALLLSFNLAPALAANRPEKPNVVLILVDDLGWQDVGCYDIDEPCPYQTPSIDRLAGQGVMFWQGYSAAPTCAPSRHAILTGKHPARSQKTHVVGGAPPRPRMPNSLLIDPWYSGRMPLSEVTIAEALKAHGYRTGHTGKWHVAINHHAFPQPEDQGFDFTRSNLGVTRKMKNRTKGFATSDADDPFRLDDNDFPYHQNLTDPLEFLQANQSEPFFLYHCNWLVHSPIHSRSERLLRKYCERMGVPYPKDPGAWKIEGQKNPYYGAMVEMLDYYTGQLLDYLDKTDDPRWPGHKLAENTYVIFTSDNGGMENASREPTTDNYPLDKGKINAREGGVRVPLLVRGPGIAAGVRTQVMANGLDFYPTILSWTGAERPAGQRLDGADLAPLLAQDPADPSLVKGPDGRVRDTLWWHFPHGPMQSTIRVGGYKLIRKWRDHLLRRPNSVELYQLYDKDNRRVDIEEQQNLAEKMPRKAKQLEAMLDERLAETSASPPLMNPRVPYRARGRDQAPKVVDSGRDGDRVWVVFEEQGAAVVRANLIYTDNGGERYEEWYRQAADLTAGRVEATLPEGATHYVLNLIDENSYLVSHPELPAMKEGPEKISEVALER